MMEFKPLNKPNQGEQQERKTKMATRKDKSAMKKRTAARAAAPKKTPKMKYKVTFEENGEDAIGCHVGEERLVADCDTYELAHEAMEDDKEAYLAQVRGAFGDDTEICNDEGTDSISGKTLWLKISIQDPLIDASCTWRIYSYATEKTTAAKAATKKLAKKAPAKNATAVTEKKPADGNVGETHEKVQLWKNGPYWATTNIGAEKPEDFGCYFWWGDIVGCKREKNKWVATDGSSSNFSFEYSKTPTLETPTRPNIDYLKDAGWISANCFLVPEHDVAHVQWGAGWRMPTDQEFKDLVKKCVWTWTTQNGVNGYVIRGKSTYASASIFLPAAGAGSESELYSGIEGNYWSSVPDSSYSAYFLSFSRKSGVIGVSSGYRWPGHTVRPVAQLTD